jgi:hypothetical protein
MSWLRRSVKSHPALLLGKAPVLKVSASRYLQCRTEATNTPTLLKPTGSHVGLAS